MPPITRHLPKIRYNQEKNTKNRYPESEACSGKAQAKKHDDVCLGTGTSVRVLSVYSFFWFFFHAGSIRTDNLFCLISSLFHSLILYDSEYV